MKFFVVVFAILAISAHQIYCAAPNKNKAAVNADFDDATKDLENVAQYLMDGNENFTLADVIINAFNKKIKKMFKRLNMTSDGDIDYFTSFVCKNIEGGMGEDRRKRAGLENLIGSLTNTLTQALTAALQNILGSLIATIKEAKEKIDNTVDDSELVFKVTLTKFGVSNSKIEKFFGLLEDIRVNMECEKYLSRTD